MRQVRRERGKREGRRGESGKPPLFSFSLITTECSLTSGLHVAWENLWYHFWTHLDNKTEAVMGEVRLGHYVVHIYFFSLVKVEVSAFSP